MLKSLAIAALFTLNAQAAEIFVGSIPAAQVEGTDASPSIRYSRATDLATVTVRFERWVSACANEVACPAELDVRGEISNTVDLFSMDASGTVSLGSVVCATTKKNWLGQTKLYWNKNCRVDVRTTGETVEAFLTTVD